ncbi:MAG: DUF494 family protein [Patescibacteria group bacterium]
MCARSKQGNSGEERIMEIVGFLLRKIIESPEEARLERHLVEGLEERGYRRSEIDAAMELIFAVPEIISSAFSRAIPDAPGRTVRVFSPLEERRLSISLRGRLLEYRALGLLSASEWEEVLMQLVFSEAREMNLADLEPALRKVVNDEERLQLISPNPIQMKVTPLH